MRLKPLYGSAGGQLVALGAGTAVYGFGLISGAGAASCNFLTGGAGGDVLGSCAVSAAGGADRDQVIYGGHIYFEDGVYVAVGGAVYSYWILVYDGAREGT